MKRSRVNNILMVIAIICEIWEKIAKRREKIFIVNFFRGGFWVVA